jgi:hypothetical protein
MASNELVEGVTYTEYKQPRPICYSEDNGQVITEPATSCTRWECLRWDGARPLAPVLVDDGRGFRVCSSCCSSHGMIAR